MRIYNEDYLYEMSNFTKRITGQPFNIWVDDTGVNRKVGHNMPRFKVLANDVELDILLHPDSGKAEFAHNNPRLITKFKYGKQAIKFIEKYAKPLLMQYNGEMDAFQLADVMRYVERNIYDMDEAITFVLKDELSK